MEKKNKNRKKQFEGVVVSNSMQGTVRVRVIPTISSRIQKGCK
jgi:ribosomal protein S17